MRKIFFTVVCAVITLSMLTKGARAEEALSLSAKSAVLINAEDNSVIYSRNCNERLPMASTTKIMTALVALENCPLDTVITVDERSVGVEGSSVYLKKGEKLTLENLLYALLLQSANDAATAIAVKVGGSVEGFADMMNKKAAELGLCDTHFSNPHGLDDENHYTTALELAKIAAAALKNPQFKKIVSTYKAEIPNEGCQRILVNHNRLLREYDGCIGVKTGFTRRCGRCLVSAASRDGLTLIAVTLSAPDDWNDHKKMLDYGFSMYETVTLTGESGIIFDIPVAGGEKEYARVCTDGNIKITLPRSDGEITVTAEMPKFMFAPLKKSTVIGKLCFYRNGKIIKEADLYTVGDCPARK